MTHTRRLTRRLVLGVLLVLAACSTAPKPAPGQPALEPNAARVRVIFDTDLGIDVDDAGALALLHALANKGEVRILATVSNVNDPYAPAALDAVNTYYRRPDLLVGRNPRAGHYAVATAYWWPEPPRFVRTVAEGFPHDTPLTGGRSAVSVYRQALAAQPDRSVTVIGVGFFVNLSDLLASPPDRYSPLSGLQLVGRKVKELVVMAGSWPNGGDHDLYLSGGREITPDYARRVLAAWPTPIVVVPGSVCSPLRNGATLATATPPTNPVRALYREFHRGLEGKGRVSWDLCAVMYGVRGLLNPYGETMFGLSSSEHMTLSADGRNSLWKTPGNGHQRRLYRVWPADRLQQNLEYLITKLPRP